jgi:hypothetical protein
VDVGTENPPTITVFRLSSAAKPSFQIIPAAHKLTEPQYLLDADWAEITSADKGPDSDASFAFTRRASV